MKARDLPALVASCVLGGLILMISCNELYAGEAIPNPWTHIKQHRVTTDPDSQTQRDVSGNKIVWHDLRKGSNVYFYDLGEDGQFGTFDDSGEIQITDVSKEKRHVRISGNKIVWAMRTAASGFKFDIYLYDLGDDGVYGTLDDSGVIQLTNDSLANIEPSISGNKIVWRSSRDGNTDIYLYDLGRDGVYGTRDDSKITRVSDDPTIQGMPSISGNKIVWADLRHGDFEIYLYDMGRDGLFGTRDDSGEIRLTNALGHQGAAEISKNKIVWMDQRDGAPDIYLYDLGKDGVYGTRDDSGELRITADEDYQGMPDISGNTIVWTDGRHDEGDVYLYDLGKDGIFGTHDDSGERRLTLGSEGQNHGRISNRKIVWWHRNSPYDNDIYIAYPGRK